VDIPAAAAAFKFRLCERAEGKPPDWAPQRRRRPSPAHL